MTRTAVRPSPRRIGRPYRRAARPELLAHLVTWCPGCGQEVTLADCVSLTVVATGTRAHTTWRCARCSH